MPKHNSRSFSRVLRRFTLHGVPSREIVAFRFVFSYLVVSLLTLLVVSVLQSRRSQTGWFYGRPPNAALWETALNENPDPSWCVLWSQMLTSLSASVPVIAVGFDDSPFAGWRSKYPNAFHLQKLKDIQSQLDALRTQHSVSNSSRILRSTTLQIQLSQRVLHLVQSFVISYPFFPAWSLCVYSKGHGWFADTNILWIRHQRLTLIEHSK